MSRVLAAPSSIRSQPAFNTVAYNQPNPYYPGNGLGFSQHQLTINAHDTNGILSSDEVSQRNKLERKSSTKAATTAGTGSRGPRRTHLEFTSANEPWGQRVDDDMKEKMALDQLARDKSKIDLGVILYDMHKDVPPSQWLDGVGVSRKPLPGKSNADKSGASSAAAVLPLVPASNSTSISSSNFGSRSDSNAAVAMDVSD
jgi:hypothetical protein